MKKKKEDIRLKKIRYFKGTFEDFKKYLEKRIKETEHETNEKR